MKHTLHNGVCADRWSCKNVNTKVCNPTNIKIDKILFGLIKIFYVNCNYYQKK